MNAFLSILIAAATPITNAFTGMGVTKHVGTSSSSVPPMDNAKIRKFRYVVTRGFVSGSGSTHLVGKRVDAEGNVLFGGSEQYICLAESLDTHLRAGEYFETDTAVLDKLDLWVRIYVHPPLKEDTSWL